MQEHTPLPVKWAGDGSEASPGLPALARPLLWGRTLNGGDTRGRTFSIGFPLRRYSTWSVRYSSLRSASSKDFVIARCKTWHTSSVSPSACSAAHQGPGPASRR